MWDWVSRVEPSYGAEPTSPGVGIMASTRLWSPPLWDYWRVTAAYDTTEDLEEGGRRGTVRGSASSTGVRRCGCSPS